MPNETYDVFVSYSRADSRHAAEIDSVLRAHGLKSFFDRRELALGLPWIRALEEAIGSAKSVIVLIGPRGLGNRKPARHYPAEPRSGLPGRAGDPSRNNDRSAVRFSQRPHLGRFLARVLIVPFGPAPDQRFLALRQDDASGRHQRFACSTQATQRSNGRKQVIVRFQHDRTDHVHAVESVLWWIDDRIKRTAGIP
jgi:hypothetical protein